MSSQLPRPLTGSPPADRHWAGLGQSRQEENGAQPTPHGLRHLTNTAGPGQRAHIVRLLKDLPVRHSPAQLQKGFPGPSPSPGH